MRRSSRYLLVACFALICAALLALIGRRPGASAPDAPPGAAIVIDPEALPEAQPPSLTELSADPGAVAAGWRSRGSIVATDPTGRCLAVGAPLPLDGEAFESAQLSPRALAACVLHHTTSEQLPQREQGYLPLNAASDTQREAFLRIARQGGWSDRDGRPTVPGASFAAGIWQSWELVVCTHGAEGVERERLVRSWRPPTPEAIVAPPLAGSPLWWVWPYAEAAWGEERVSLPPDVYSLSDVLAEMRRTSGVAFAPPAGEGARLVMVAAEGIEVRKLLWAVEVALGCRSQTMPEEGGNVTEVALQPDAEQPVDGDGLRAVARGRYYSPRMSAVGPELLPKLQELPPAAYWVGWRYADLPRLYQDLAADGWQQTVRLHHNTDAPALDLERTFVIWTKAILVAAAVRTGSGGMEGEFMFPAL